MRDRLFRTTSTRFCIFDTVYTNLFGPVAQLVRSRELIILRPLFESRRDYQWSNGGIGRRNALKMHRCKTCQFKSDFDYHAIHSARGHTKLELSNY